MIAFLKGKSLSVNESFVVIDVSGVGYKVHATIPLLLSISEGQEISLYIHSHIREDQFTLYGFANSSDIFLFEKLLSVSGIGPKSALAMLSIHSPSSIANAVEQSKAEALSGIPGVGKKTIEKMIIELKGKLLQFKGKEETDAMYEVRLALETLGYSSKEIQRVVQEISSDEKSTSSLIKEALQLLK